MPKKKSGKKEKENPLFGGIPLGSAMDVFEGLGSLAVKLFSSKAQVEKKVDEFRKETGKQVEELRDEAVRTGYEVKKAFLRAVVETILLASGILSLVLGLILLVKKMVPLEYVLLGYGFVILFFVLLTVKLSPENG